jgi:hypothetical protein
VKHPFTWRVVGPTNWATAPARLSHSVSRDIRRCPRQWALSKSGYSFGTGYPRRYGPAAVAGLVVHAALELVVERIKSRDVVETAPLLATLRDLGGISGVVSMARDHVLADLKINPRMEHRIARVESDLSRRDVQIHEAVRHSLAKLRWDAHQPTGIDGRGHAALGLGIHSEVRLAPKRIPWVGWADAISLSPGLCEILDFKSGIPKPEHEEQLRTYATLWRFDESLNPTGRRVNSLRLIYPNLEKVIEPPTEADLESIAAGLSQLYRDISAQLDGGVPPALPAPEVCPGCDVRHLCSEFWAPQFQADLPGEVQFRSVQLAMHGPRAPGVWNADVEVDPAFREGTKALLVTDRDLQIERGHSLRILDAQVEMRERGEPIYSVTRNSEAFLMPSRALA